jgi:hypothetical protein
MAAPRRNWLKREEPLDSLEVDININAPTMFFQFVIFRTGEHILHRYQMLGRPEQHASPPAASTRHPSHLG